MKIRVEKKNYWKLRKRKKQKNIRCKRGRNNEKGLVVPPLSGTITKDVKESALSGKRDGADILELRWIC